jgi:bifunctional non-homologous end joining protein LigD
VTVPSETGVSDFSVLQNELRGKSNKLVLYAFDLLYLDGFDLRKALPCLSARLCCAS